MSEVPLYGVLAQVVAYFLSAGMLTLMVAWSAVIGPEAWSLYGPRWGRFLTSEVPLYGVLAQVVAYLLSCGV